MRMSTDRDWLRKQAEEERKHFVSVGGLPATITEEERKRVDQTRPAFMRLVQLERRKRSLTMEEFASETGLGLADVVHLELDEQFEPTPHAVHRLASFLKLPFQKLMALAGLLELKDTHFGEATLRFAARSQPVAKLSKEEQTALDEYVKFLSEQ